MCEDCGCEQGNRHYFDHHTHAHGEVQKKILVIEQNILQKNNHIAGQNKQWLAKHSMKAVNLISSPGSGKTALLERTMVDIGKELNCSVLVGDQQTDNDAARLLDSGAKVKQINTYSSCHLDAVMVKKELGTFVTGDEDLLIIENIGNLVCPAAFDLGEDEKIALLSTTEGEDKPIKYPVLFNRATTVVITKMDLEPYLDWSLDKTKKYIRQVNPKAKIICLSSKTGEGMDQWYEYLKGL